MKKKKAEPCNFAIKPFLPLDTKRRIDAVISHIKRNKIPYTNALDSLVCSCITDNNLRFYYDCVSPPKAHNRPDSPPIETKKKKRTYLGELSQITNKNKKKVRSSGRLVAIDPYRADYIDQLRRVSLKGRFGGFEYGLSDW